MDVDCVDGRGPCVNRIIYVTSVWCHGYSGIISVPSIDLVIFFCERTDGVGAGRVSGNELGDDINAEVMALIRR